MTAGQASLYGTIWVALALFVVGQPRGVRVYMSSAWWLWLAGALLCLAHITIALAIRHGWSHGAAVHATAVQTETVFGLRWGGGVYVNYLFVSVWLSEAMWWRVDPISFARRSPIVAWLVRAFYLVVILNAAIVFAAPTRRIAGVLVIIALLWIWWPATSRSEPRKRTLRANEQRTL